MAAVPSAADAAVDVAAAVVASVTMAVATSRHSHRTGMRESDRERIHRLEGRVHELECTLNQLLERLGESVGITGGGGPETLPSINQQLKQACGA